MQYLHQHKDFGALLSIVSDEMSIEPALIEKDYWIKHALYGLKKLGLEFELKGGTSLSKAHKIINRFSEDIDVHIKPPAHFNINENPNNKNSKNIVARKDFFDWLAADKLKIDGMHAVRDTEFDDEKLYRNGGIRLHYETRMGKIEGLKDGILLEVGFVVIAPVEKKIISSWAYDKAIQNPEISIADNRAMDIDCYHPGYTFVEKLQTVSTKYRLEQEKPGQKKKVNFMRQYYDLYCLLNDPEVLKFLGTEAYFQHKQKHFPQEDFVIPLAENEAFLLHDETIRADFKSRYTATSTLYYRGQPDFDDLISGISRYLHRL